MNVRVLDNANSLNISDFIPDYKKFFGMLLVNKEEFSRMVRKILILFQRDFAKVVFGLERYWIRSKITNQAFGSMNDSIQVLSNNKTVPVYLGLNPVYISDVLKGYEEGLVRVYYKDNVSPIIMDFNKEEYDFMALIMPMRVD
jgi:DNA polymerase III sliding clamp (beta) subunit (PCNA family)